MGFSNPGPGGGYGPQSDPGAPGYGPAAATGGYAPAPGTGGYGTAPGTGGYIPAAGTGGYGTGTPAGGYGPPSERDPALVRRDVALGYVSEARARVDYPHAFADGSADAERE